MRHPNNIEKMNYVVEFITDPCDAPFQVYVRTFWPAFLKALISYYALDLIQIWTGYIRPNQQPKVKRGGSHRRGAAQKSKPRTFLRAWRRISGFDPWDTAGRNIPGADDLGRRVPSVGVLHLWSIYGILERFAWWIMVINITHEFFYSWASGVNESIYCRQQNRPWAMGRQPYQSGDGLPAYWPVTFPIIEKQRGSAVVVGNGGNAGSVGYQAIFQCSVKPRLGHGVPATFCYPVMFRGGVPSADGPPTPDDDGVFTVGSRGNANEQVTCYIHSDGAWELEGATLTVIGDVAHGSS